MIRSPKRFTADFKTTLGLSFPAVGYISRCFETGSNKIAAVNRTVTADYLGIYLVSGR